MSVYKLTCNETGKVYYGSTKNTFGRRKSNGWKECSCKDFVNPTIEIVEKVDDLDNLLEREDYYIRNFECINERRAMKTDEEKDAYKSEYYLKNKDKLTERQREYYSKNTDKISERNRQWRLKNKDKLKEKKRQYYLKNKEKILAQQREYRLKKQQNSK